MEGNDLGNDFGKRIVVVMEPLLVDRQETPSSWRRFIEGRRIGRTDRLLQETVDSYTINASMVAFIKTMGYQYSVGTEVWSFLPETVFDALAVRLDSVLHHNVVGYERWNDPRDAWMRLRTSPEILTVYDADRSRIELWWQMRGQSVLRGSAP